jgi:hypothetical protein
MELSKVMTKRELDSNDFVSFIEIHSETTLIIPVNSLGPFPSIKYYCSLLQCPYCQTCRREKGQGCCDQGFAQGTRITIGHVRCAGVGLGCAVLFGVSFACCMFPSILLAMCVCYAMQ